MHGRLTVERAELLRRMKSERGALLLDSGDAVTVPNVMPVSWRTKMAGTMAAAGYDAMGMGNREWDFTALGVWCVTRTLSFPLVATNIDAPGYARIEKMVVLDTAAGKVAVLGAARNMRVPAWIAPLGKVRWRDPAEALAAMVPSAKDEAEWVVVLSHLGLAGDLELAAKIEGVDLILGGHDHVLTTQPLGEDGAVKVVHSGSYLHWVTAISLDRGEDGRAIVEVEPVRLP
jgi:2',3'-cyclic-nucleotide 2'-phosphodiesterase (5'-nucleotidase family)